MARWKARVEFLLSVIELLFLSLSVESLKGKRVQNLQEGKVTWSQDFRGKGSSPCQYIDTTRKAINCATTLPLTVFTARRNARIASAVLAIAIPSVRPFVCPSQAGIVSK